MTYVQKALDPNEPCIKCGAPQRQVVRNYEQMNCECEYPSGFLPEPKPRYRYERIQANDEWEATLMTQGIMYWVIDDGEDAAIAFMESEVIAQKVTEALNMLQKVLERIK